MNLPSAAKNNKLISVTVIGVIAVILAAAAEALYTPLSKFFVMETGPLMSLAFLFFGGGAGLLLVLLFGRKSKAIYDPKRRLQKKDTGKLIGIIFLTALANLLFLLGLQQESAATASILQNADTVVTVVFAAILLKEKISKRLGIGVGLIILGSIALSITDLTTLSFSTGSLLILGASVCFGGLFTVTKLLADRNPIICSIIRGFGVGILALIAAFSLGETLPSLPTALGLMTVGFVSCGLSSMLLMYGQRYLGAAKSGAIFGMYPLLGAAFAILFLSEIPSASFVAALVLFIPGMYFVITKNSSTAAEKTEEAGKQSVGDTQFFTSITDSRKTDMKNHMTSFGLLIIALFFFMMMLDIFNPGTAEAAADTLAPSFYLPGAVLGLSILLTGIVLLILGKRVIAAVTFILMAPQMLSTAILGEMPMMNILSGSLLLIFALILMMAKDKQKYAFAVVNLLLGVATITRNFDNNALCGLIMAAAAIYLIWLSIACGTGKLRFSISKYLIEDGEMTFRRCGAVIGYLLLTEYLIIVLIYECIGDPTFSSAPDSLETIWTIYICLLVFVGLMMMFIGKQRVTSIFFIGFGVAFLLGLTSPERFGYLSVILLLALGIQNVLRKDPRILPSFLVIGEAFALMLYYQTALVPGVMVAAFLLTAACAIVALYLAFAVFSEKPKLPLF